MKIGCLKYVDNSHPVKHDDYLTELEKTISCVFFRNYLSPKVHQESLRTIKRKSKTEFWGLSDVRWLASLTRSLSKLDYFKLQGN